MKTVDEARIRLDEVESEIALAEVRRLDKLLSGGRLAPSVRRLICRSRANAVARADCAIGSGERETPKPFYAYEDCMRDWGARP